MTTKTRTRTFLILTAALLLACAARPAAALPQPVPCCPSEHHLQAEGLQFSPGGSLAITRLEPRVGQFGGLGAPVAATVYLPLDGGEAIYRFGTPAEDR